MTPEQYGRLTALVERTHDAVIEIRQQQVRQWERIDDLRVSMAQHRIWLRVLAGVVSLIALGAGGVAGVVGATAKTVVGVP